MWHIINHHFIKIEIWAKWILSSFQVLHVPKACKTLEIRGRGESNCHSVSCSIKIYQSTSKLSTMQCTTSLNNRSLHYYVRPSKLSHFKEKTLFLNLVWWKQLYQLVDVMISYRKHLWWTKFVCPCNSLF